MKRDLFRRMLVTGVVILGTVPAAAVADGWRHPGGPPGWRPGWHPSPYHYYMRPHYLPPPVIYAPPPPVYYAPPPVIYAPPPVVAAPGGINIVVPLSIR